MNSPQQLIRKKRPDGITIERCKLTAKERGYECLSRHVYRTADKLRWKCNYCGREWTASFNSIRQGTGCPYCRNSCNDMENRCRVVLETLFDKPFIRCKPFKDMGSYLEIDCYNDEMKLGLEYDGWQHRKFPPFWKANIPIKERDREKEILCKRKKILLIRVNDLEASQLNIVDIIIKKLHLNNVTINTPSSKTLSRLRVPTDSIYKRIYGTEYLLNLQRICKSRGGTLLTKVWAGNHHKYKMICIKNHRFNTAYYNIIAGVWCPFCARERTTNAAHSRRIGIKRCKQIAIKRNGLCLSKNYINAQTHMNWWCNKHHLKWRSTAAEVIISGTWCPKCGHERAVEMRKVKQ